MSPPLSPAYSYVAPRPHAPAITVWRSMVLRKERELRRVEDGKKVAVFWVEQGRAGLTHQEEIADSAMSATKPRAMIF